MCWINRNNMFNTFLSVNTACEAKVFTGFIEWLYTHMLLNKCLRCWHMEFVSMHTRYHGDCCSGDFTMKVFCCLKVKQILVNVGISLRIIIIFCRPIFLWKSWLLFCSRSSSLHLFPPMWNKQSAVATQEKLVCQWAGVQVCRCTGVHVFRCAGVKFHWKTWWLPAPQFKVTGLKWQWEELVCMLASLASALTQKGSIWQSSLLHLTIMGSSVESNSGCGCPNHNLFMRMHIICCPTEGGGWWEMEDHHTATSLLISCVVCPQDIKEFSHASNSVVPPGWTCFTTSTGSIYGCLYICTYAHLAERVTESKFSFSTWTTLNISITGVFKFPSFPPSFLTSFLPSFSASSNSISYSWWHQCFLHLDEQPLKML